MHEMSLTSALLSQVEQLCLRQGGGRPLEIHVEVGPLAGVEPLLLESAFERLAPRSFAAGAALRIDLVPLEGRCRRCGDRFEIHNFHFHCPSCRGDAVQVTRGDQFQLVSVTIQTEESTAGVTK